MSSESWALSITAATALRFSHFLGCSPEFWLNLQSAYDLSVALTEHGPAIEREVHPRNELAA